ncbi:MAG: response regulator [Proteobacteria bacterium]|nr:response regulator [Burkholderiales bacterium]
MAEERRMDATSGNTGKRVVIIDDNVDSVEALSMLLELEGHTVSAAYDGPSGLALIASMRPDVVLCDIGLPGMNGYEVAESVRRLGTAAPVLAAITGYGQSSDIRRAREAGFSHHLVKPVDPVAVLTLLNES